MRKSQITKNAVRQALTRLESQALHWEGYHGRGTEKPVADARLVRRFVEAERQEILILRRWVLLAADRLSDAFNGADTSDNLIAEMRERANPKRVQK